VPNYKKTIRIGWSFSLYKDIILLMLKKNKSLKNKKMTPANLCGWYGMSAMIIGYILVSFNMVAADGLPYQLLNITGAAGLLIVAESKHVIQSVLANTFWLLIGLVILCRILFNF